MVGRRCAVGYARSRGGPGGGAVGSRNQKGRTDGSIACVMVLLSEMSSGHYSFASIVSICPNLRWTSGRYQEMFAEACSRSYHGSCSPCHPRQQTRFEFLPVAKHIERMADRWPTKAPRVLRSRTAAKVGTAVEDRRRPGHEKHGTMIRNQKQARYLPRRGYWVSHSKRCKGWRPCRERAGAAMDCQRRQQTKLIRRSMMASRIECA
jgi:hypothetical protein